MVIASIFISVRKKRLFPIGNDDKYISKLQHMADIGAGMSVVQFWVTRRRRQEAVDRPGA